MIMLFDVVNFKITNKSFYDCSTIVDITASVIKMVSGGYIEFTPIFFNHVILSPIVMMPSR